LHICAVCAFEYEDRGSDLPDFHELEGDWLCPNCGIASHMFHHYSCEHLVREMTGKSGPHQPFSTLKL